MRLVAVHELSEIILQAFMGFSRVLEADWMP